MTPSEQITSRIKTLADWRGKTLAPLRTLIGAAAPDLAEDWKWNTPVWKGRGNVLAVGAFADHVKINFFKGASLDDPKRLFNAGLDESAFKSLVRAATVLDVSSPAQRSSARSC